MIHGNAADLVDLLSVHPASGGSYEAGQVRDARSRVYGGQFLGQGVYAASLEGRGALRSFHSYYLRPGATDLPIGYRMEPLSDTVVNVSAEQREKLLFLMMAGFGPFCPAPPVEMPDVPPPDACTPRERGIEGLDRNTDSTWAVIDSPFDNRFVENIWSEGYRQPRHHVWFRLREPGALPDRIDQIMMQAITAYYADDTIMDNALFPHGWHRCWSELQTASLDHAMWFHGPIDLRRWHLFAQDSPVARGGRAMTRGTIFDERGAVVASAIQEILLREPPGGKP
jgi:acyl-CoA thioesterase-2